MHPKIIIAGVVVIVLIIGAALIMLASPAGAPTNEPPTTDTGNAAAKANLIKAAAPMPGTKITSPLTITGEARGYWYFEASFPIEVQDASGTVIGQGYAQANGEWMTEDFVPFTSIPITFTAQPAGSKGKVILRKDNPSALPENDDHLEIPIVF